MGEAALADAPTVIWRPRSRPQAAFIQCPVFEIFFGGARGSLKTGSALGDWLNHASRFGADAAGLMVRRTREQLKSTIREAKALYEPLGFKFRRNDTECVAPNGAILTFAYLDRDADAENYQGWNLTRVYVEEIGNFPNPTPVLKLMATLRSAKGVPCGFRATGNPGGPGHTWVKARYIDDDPKGWTVRRFEYANPWTHEKVTRDRVFIPGRITDHDLLGPEYVANLQMSGNEQLVRAWLEGDWDVVLGAYFDCWRQDLHVIEPFPLQEHWLRFRSMDWGSARPFSIGWWVVLSEDTPIEGRVLPKGAMVRYREWYGASGPNEGLKLYAEDVAKGIKEREAEDPVANDEGDRVTYGVADPACFASDGGPSIAERMAREGIKWRPADNRRLGDVGRMGGWDQMRARLVGMDGKPMIYCFSTCKDSIRTIPALQHDENRPEDVDTEGEDHAGDEWRYACMSRPWMRPTPKEPEDIQGLEGMTLDRLFREEEKRRRRRKR